MPIRGFGNFGTRRPSGRLLALLLKRAAEKRKQPQSQGSGGGANVKGIMDGIASIAKALGGARGGGGSRGGGGASGGGRAGGGG